MKHLSLVLAALVAVAVGCATSQQSQAPLKPKHVARVGMTTAEIQAEFGKPKHISQTPTGTTWMYDNTELLMVPFNFGWRLKQHVFNFDSQGKLADFRVDDF